MISIHDAFIYSELPRAILFLHGRQVTELRKSTHNEHPRSLAIRLQLKKGNSTRSDQQGLLSIERPHL